MLAWMGFPERRLLPGGTVGARPGGLGPRRHRSCPSASRPSFQACPARSSASRLAGFSSPLDYCHSSSTTGAGAGVASVPGEGSTSVSWDRHLSLQQGREWGRGVGLLLTAQAVPWGRLLTSHSCWACAGGLALCWAPSCFHLPPGQGQWHGGAWPAHLPGRPAPRFSPPASLGLGARVSSPDYTLGQGQQVFQARLQDKQRREETFSEEV